MHATSSTQLRSMCGAYRSGVKTIYRQWRTAVPGRSTLHHSLKEDVPRCSSQLYISKRALLHSLPSRRLLFSFGLLSLLCKGLLFLVGLLLVFPQRLTRPAIHFRPMYTDMAPRMTACITSTSMNNVSRNCVESTLLFGRHMIARAITWHCTPSSTTRRCKRDSSSSPQRQPSRN